MNSNAKTKALHFLISLHRLPIPFSFTLILPRHAFWSSIDRQTAVVFYWLARTGRQSVCGKKMHIFCAIDI